MTSPGAPPIERGTATVNGITVPDALLVPDSWLPSLFVGVSPVEVSWFADVPVPRAVAVCGEVTGIAPRVRHVVDRYFDTPDRDLFRSRVSVRVRQHLEPPRDVAFEIIANGWDEPSAPRRVSGFVQTFRHNQASDLPRLLERYARAGFEQVACFDKVRHTFSLLPGRSIDASGVEVIAGELRGIGQAQGYLRVLDFGLKVEVDELRDSPFAEPAIIEVDYDTAHEH
ncbi:MAG TPA: CYTH domain-containing protein, partial [Longimicrobiaceae bacterium]